MRVVVVQPAQQGVRIGVKMRLYIQPAAFRPRLCGGLFPSAQAARAFPLSPRGYLAPPRRDGGV